MAKAKGTTLIGCVKFLRKNRDQAVSVLPEHLHHYLNEMVSPATWYPESDLIELIRALLQLMPGNRDEVLLLMGRETAKLQGDGIYSHLLEGGASAAGGSALWSSMHDTGELVAGGAEHGRLQIDLAGYEGASPEMCKIIEGYIVESLRMGGRIATAQKIACALDGGDRCSWNCTWESEAAEA